MGKNIFEIGLVMAGAVSAGAYTGGVIDFLLQALSEWDQAKKSGSDEAPPHKVQLKVLTGASAGGMTAAMLAAMVNESFTNISCLPGREPTQEEINQNKLYNAWVDQVDISKLLQANDLKKSKSRVTSLLDSTVLDDIADATIRFNANGTRPDYISEMLHLYLTVTNLQGIPYDIQFKGRSGKGHTITQHTDFFHFLLSDHQPQSRETEWLDPKNDAHTNWGLLKNVALATGAFPGGLAPRIIERPFSHYDFRSWPVPLRPDSSDPSAPNKCIEMQTIAPSWPPHRDDQFNFLSVDGGVMDNEPLELARQTLAGDSQFNPRGAENVSRSVLMVDPFPSEKITTLQKRANVEDYDIVSVFSQLFGSLIAQSRFKPDELILANSDDVYSRFLIAPTRYTQDDQKAEYPIASGFLNGFGGFISKKIRMHDFQLGRRNCQQFLRRYFALPVEQAKNNSIFGDYTEDDFERFSYQKNGTRFLPIIPLVGETKEEAFPMHWKTLEMTDRELDELRQKVTNRTKIVIDRLINQYIDGGFTRSAAKLVARFKRNNIVNKIMGIIEDDLTEFKLKS